MTIEKLRSMRLTGMADTHYSSTQNKYVRGLHS
jgi:hypothetical protein